MCDLCLRKTAYTKRGWTGYSIAESLASCWSGPNGLSCTSLTLNWIQYLKRGTIWREEKKQNRHIFRLKHFSSAQPQFIHGYSDVIVKHAESVSQHPPLKGLPLPLRDSSLPLFSSPCCCLRLLPPAPQQSEV